METEKLNFLCLLCACQVKKRVNSCYLHRVRILKYCRTCLINHIYGRNLYDVNDVIMFKINKSVLIMTSLNNHDTQEACVKINTIIEELPKYISDPT